MVGSCCLNFGNGDGTGGTDLYTAFAAQALVDVHDYGFAFLHFQHAGGANVHALFIASAFFFIDVDIPTHESFILLLEYSRSLFLS
jgi:hypothetical protein